MKSKLTCDQRAAWQMLKDPHVALQCARKSYYWDLLSNLIDHVESNTSNSEGERLQRIIDYWRHARDELEKTQ